MQKLAVLGNPIEHSLSPIIFSLFAKQFNLSLSYEKILAIDATEFITKVKILFDSGYIGLNVTSPFKHIAYSSSKKHTAKSSFCRAGNFLSRTDDGDIILDTTDGLGLVTDLQNNHNLHLANKKILIIGSGYVLDSILLDLIVNNPAEIDILARNKKRVNFLTAKFACGVFNSNKHYDLIISSIPNGIINNLYNQIINLDDNTFCYDLTYANNGLFITTMQSKNSKIKSYNGLGMLVEQAKVAFIQLFNHIPNTKSVLENLSKIGYNV